MVKKRFSENDRSALERKQTNDGGRKNANPIVEVLFIFADAWRQKADLLVEVDPVELGTETVYDA
jgi:hypothetical protein